MNAAGQINRLKFGMDNDPDSNWLMILAIIIMILMIVAHR